MAEVDPKRVRDIKIKTGVVKRLGKEKEMYAQEAKGLAEKVEKMKADNKDEYDIRKQTEVYEESAMMIPDCRRRLVEAWNTLSQLMESESDLCDTEEYKAAKQVLADNEAATKQ